MKTKEKETGYRPGALSEEQERRVEDGELLSWLEQVA